MPALSLDLLGTPGPLGSWGHRPWPRSARPRVVTISNQHGPIAIFWQQAQLYQGAPAGAQPGGTFLVLSPVHPTAGALGLFQQPGLKELNLLT